MLRYAQLHAYLLSAMDDIKTSAASVGVDRFRLDIACSCEEYDGTTIKYTVREKYESGPEGNSLAPVIQEFLHRYNWKIANNTKQIAAPQSAPSTDDEIPF